MSKPTPAQERAQRLQQNPDTTPAKERAREAARTDSAVNNPTDRERDLQALETLPRVPDAAVPRPIIVRPPAGGR